MVMMRRRMKVVVVVNRMKMVMVVNRIKMVMVVIVDSMRMSIIGVLVFYFALPLHHGLLLAIWEEVWCRV